MQDDAVSCGANRGEGLPLPTGKTSLTIRSCPLSLFHCSPASDSPQTQTQVVLWWPDANLQQQPKRLFCQAVSPLCSPGRKGIGAGSQRAHPETGQRRPSTPFSPHPVSWVGDECESLSATSLVSSGHDAVEGNLDYPTWLSLLPSVAPQGAEG